jgi:hypothetical protein
MASKAAWSLAERALIDGRSAKPCKDHFDILLRIGAAPTQHSYAIGTNMWKFGRLKISREEFLAEIESTHSNLNDKCFICRAANQENGHSRALSPSRRGAGVKSHDPEGPARCLGGTETGIAHRPCNRRHGAKVVRPLDAKAARARQRPSERSRRDTSCVAVGQIGESGN